MHVEALEVLPELLGRLGIGEPVLVGHSDGGSIALIHAAMNRSVRGLVVMAPHVFVEDISVKSIAEAKTAFESTDLAQKLGRYHADAAKTFRGWNDVWLHPDFRSWNIEEVLRGYIVRCSRSRASTTNTGRWRSSTRSPGRPAVRSSCCAWPTAAIPAARPAAVVLEAMVSFIDRLEGGS